MLAWFKEIGHTKLNWVMARGDCDEPFLLPRKGKLVAPEIMQLAYDFEPETDLRERILEVLAEENPTSVAVPQEPLPTS